MPNTLWVPSAALPLLRGQRLLVVYPVTVVPFMVSNKTLILFKMVMCASRKFLFPPTLLSDDILVDEI